MVRASCSSKARQPRMLAMTASRKGSRPSNTQSLAMPAP